MSENLFRQAGPLLGMGTQFGITIVLGFLLGDWLDEKYNTSPILTLLCTLIFAAIGMYIFIKQANKTVDDRDN